MGRIRGSLGIVGGVIVLGTFSLTSLSAAASTTSTTLYVATTGTNSGNCQSAATPCLTIQYAVGQAEADAGAVTIEIAGGTYPEQVTVAPTSASPMTSLTLQGPTSGSPAVVKPSALVQNIFETRTSYGFDVNTGNVSAIIGVQTGSVDTAVGSTTIAPVPASVTVANLAVDGGGLPDVAPAIPWAGIAFIDTSGNVDNNVIQNIQIPAAMGDASAVGIAVKSTAAAQTVGIAHNVLSPHAGFVYVNLIGGTPGSLSATVTGNTIVGDPTLASAQFGITAGGLSSLNLSGNTVSYFQSPYDVGAIWLERQASGASCSVTGNNLIANDDGVDVRGAAGCVISRNTITAGAAGIEIGSGYSATTAESINTVVSGNMISGTPTAATYKWYSGAATVAGAPIVGVLVWDGTGSSITGNGIGGFVSDVYVGNDPVYNNNTATWGSGGAPAGNSISGTTVSANSLGTPAAAKSGSGVSSYGVACLNSAGECTATPLNAKDNWWGSASGPGPVAAGAGVPVSKNVDYSAWCTTASCIVVPAPGKGYWLVAADGGIFPFGDAGGYGSTGNITLNKPMVGMASTPNGEGYWLVAADGGIFPFGNAVGYGSTGGMKLNTTIAGMAATPDGAGYWLVGADGAVFPFGDAVNYGSMAGQYISAPVVGIVSTPDGKGYWMVGSDGNVYAFGDAVSYGSMAGQHLNKPVVGMAATPDGKGYWLVAADGGIFPFGDAGGYGSTGNITLNKPMVGMAGVA